MNIIKNYLDLNFSDSLGNLEHLESVRGFSWCQARLHRSVLIVFINKSTTVFLEDVQISNQLFLEVFLQSRIIFKYWQFGIYF